MQTANPLLLHPHEPFMHEQRVLSSRQRSFSDVRITPKEIDHWGAMGAFPSSGSGVGGGSHALSSESQNIWESLMTLRHTRQMSLASHLARALPLLTHPSLPLPPPLQVLVFTSSLSPQLRALIMTCHPAINSLPEAVDAARLAEKAKQRMDWIGHTMEAAEAQPRARRPSTASVSSQPQRPATSRKRSFTDDAEGRKHKKMKKVTISPDLRYSPAHSPRSAPHYSDDSRPGSREESYGSPDSGRSGMDYLADAAVEAAREQLQRL